MGDIMGLVFLAVIVFYGMCVILLPICVFMIHGTLSRCLQELRKINKAIEKEQLFMEQEKADAAKYIFKEGDYVRFPDGQEAKIRRIPKLLKLCAVTTGNVILAQGQEEFEHQRIIKFGAK